ncbi:MAG: hypothetical protein JJU13_07140 [Balneolaceae bacterium]|nr:hypothetical protein [Balneolaceae bacterium]
MNQFKPYLLFFIFLFVCCDSDDNSDLFDPDNTAAEEVQQEPGENTLDQNSLQSLQEESKSVETQIHIESSRYDGLSDTERIDRAVADAIGEDAQLVFGTGPYFYNGRKTISEPVNWLGTQGDTFDQDETVIYITGRWTFEGEGKTKLTGIAIDGGREFTGDVVRVNSSVDEIVFDRCHIMGALHRKESAAGIVLNVNGNAGSIIFTNGSISDAHSESPIETASTDGSTSGGWRIWPSIRGFNASSGFDGYLEMKNVDIFNIGHEVAYGDGGKVWENPDASGSINPGGWDIDAWQRSGREGTGTTLLEDVRFYSSPGSFIKVSQHGGTLHFKNLDIHIREGQPIAGRPIRLQSSGDGYQRNGTMENVRIRADRSRDLSRMGGGSALHMLMSFSGNLPDETFHIKNTVIEIGKDEEDPVYLDNQAIFGYHRTDDAKHGLIIENTKVDVPGGIEWFFRTSANAQSSQERAKNRVNQVTFLNNRDMKQIRRFYYANPFQSRCNGCRVYTHHDVTLKGVNSYYNLNGEYHEVEPVISPSDIWRSGGSSFSGCDCEEDLLDMYLFTIQEKKE